MGDIEKNQAEFFFLARRDTMTELKKSIERASAQLPQKQIIQNYQSGDQKYNNENDKENLLGIRRRRKGKKR